MLEISAALFGITVWALIFRLSVGLLERGNPRNTFGTALLLGLVFGFIAPYAMSAFFLFGLFLGLLSLVALFRILIHHYELSFFRALGAILLAEGGLYLAREVFVALYRASPTAAQALVVALPAVVLVSWRMLRRQEKLDTRSEVPRARAMKWRRPLEPKRPPSASKPAPAPAPPVAEKDREPNLLR